MTDEANRLANLRAELRAAERARRTLSAHGEGSWPSVKAAFLEWQLQFEGYTTFMYADSLGYITTGIGDLIEAIGSSTPWTPALSVPFKRRDGSLASQEEIISEWQLVKSKWPGIQSFADQNITQLRITKEDVRTLVMAKFASNEAYLVAKLPGYSQAPADAQMAVGGMAWAMGAGFIDSFVSFKAHFVAKDFAGAALQSNCKNCSAGRNSATKASLMFADIVYKNKMDPSVLWYPKTPTPSTVGGTVGKVVTVLALAGASYAGYHYRHEIAEFTHEQHAKWEKSIAAMKAKKALKA